MLQNVGSFKKLTYPEDSEQLNYVGDVNNQKPNGKGWMTYKNGDFKFGDWVDGQIKGKYFVSFGENEEYYSETREGNQGTLIWKNGDTFIGEFDAEDYRTNGTQYFSNGEVYVGQWFKGVKHGTGIFYYDEDDYYERQHFEGSFENDERRQLEEAVCSMLA